MIVYENTPGAFVEVTSDLNTGDIIIPFANFALWDDATLAAHNCYHLEFENIPSGKIRTGYTIQLVNGSPAIVSTYADAPSPPVPQSITPRQARLALAATQHGAGTLLDAVDAAVNAADKATQITWEYATEIQRDNAIIASMASALGLSSATVDQLFITASTL